MMASRGMGDISPSKMPKGKRKARRDDTDFTQYAEGGKVNAAGNYTKVTKIINGGTIGLDDRIKHVQHALAVLG